MNHPRDPARFRRSRGVGPVTHCCSMALLVATLLAKAGGCVQPPTRIRLDPVPIRRAMEIVNENAALVHSTLRAIGSVDGRFRTDNGVMRSFHVQGVLFFHEPIFLRFDLKKLGNRQFLLGCNENDFWVYSAADEDYYCGKRSRPDDWPPDMPLRPDQLVDAIGLGTLPAAGKAGPPLQRVVDDYQQILFPAEAEDGALYLEREYWVDRYPPRLVRRVIFRDVDGRMQMENQLSDYRPMEGTEALLPYEFLANWPAQQSQMRFRVSKWSAFPQVAPHDIQFATPAQCNNAPRLSRR